VFVGAIGGRDRAGQARGRRHARAGSRSRGRRLGPRAQAASGHADALPRAGAPAQHGSALACGRAYFCALFMMAMSRSKRRVRSFRSLSASARDLLRGGDRARSFPSLIDVN
jgi:hypothetical protein